MASVEHGNLPCYREFYIPRWIFSYALKKRIPRTETCANISNAEHVLFCRNLARLAGTTRPTHLDAPHGCPVRNCSNAITNILGWEAGRIAGCINVSDGFSTNLPG